MPSESSPVEMPPEPISPRPWLASFFDTHKPMLGYVWRMGWIGLLPSVAINVLLALTGLVNEKNLPKYHGNGVALFLSIVVFAPIVETLLLALTLKILSFFFKDRVRLAAAAAVVWAILHSLQAPSWGLVIAWPFFVFSCAYLAWRKISRWRAFQAACLIHMFQNFLPGLIMACFK